MKGAENQSEKVRLWVWSGRIAGWAQKYLADPKQNKEKVRLWKVK